MAADFIERIFCTRSRGYYDVYFLRYQQSLNLKFPSGLDLAFKSWVDEEVCQGPNGRNIEEGRCGRGRCAPTALIAKGAPVIE